MYTDIPTNGDVVSMLVLLSLAIVSLLICVNHCDTNQVDDIASWLQNYEKIQRRR